MSILLRWVVLYQKQKLNLPPSLPSRKKLNKKERKRKMARKKMLTSLVLNTLKNKISASGIVRLSQSLR